MKFTRVALHGFMLTLINIVSIVGGLLAYQYLFRHHHPLHVQVPVGLVLTSCGFLFWKMLVRVTGRISIMLQSMPEYIAVYCAALIWTPLIFIPVHKILTGYITAPGNIMVIWIFQIWANAIAIAVVGWLDRWVKYAIEITS